MILRSTCFLCDETLQPIGDRLQAHPESEFCNVRFTDEFGVAVEITSDELADADEGRPGNVDFFEELENLRLFPFVEKVLEEIFERYGVSRLGGASTGRGWSAFSTFQRCNYLFYRRYVEPLEQVSIMPALEPESRAIGTVAHALLAVYYTRMIVHDYPLTPDLLRDEMLKSANPEFVNEGWRLFLAYSLYYQNEEIMPLAVEYDLRDPRTGESCRYDLIAFFPHATSDRLAGTYILEHKTKQRFDDNALNGWANDGEVLGQVMLWKRMKLHLRYGELKGVIVNLLGRQKEPKFHRTTVAPETWQQAQHARDLVHTEAQIAVAKATGVFRRARANCINQWGKCDLWDHCASDNDDR